MGYFYIMSLKKKEIKETYMTAARCKDFTLIKAGVEESTRSYAPALKTAVILKLLLCSRC